MAFFSKLINRMAGLRHVNPIHFRVAEEYGARNRDILVRAVLPGSLPLVLVGVRLADATALSLAAAVKLVSGQRGLRAIIWLAWETLRT